jgi:hypothetical protein
MRSVARETDRWMCLAGEVTEEMLDFILQVTLDLETGERDKI